MIQSKILTLSILGRRSKNCSVKFRLRVAIQADLTAKLSTVCSVGFCVSAQLVSRCP